MYNAVRDPSDATQWHDMAGGIIPSPQPAGSTRGTRSLVSMKFCCTRGQSAQVMARCMFVPEYGERSGWGRGKWGSPGRLLPPMDSPRGAHPWGNEGRACTTLQRREVVAPRRRLRGVVVSGRKYIAERRSAGLRGGDGTIALVDGPGKRGAAREFLVDGELVHGRRNCWAPDDHNYGGVRCDAGLDVRSSPSQWYTPR